MSYHLTILRSANGLQLPITLAEAQAAAGRLPGWRATGDAQFEYADARGSLLLWHGDGELWARLGDAWQLAPMLALAAELDARVRGDEFETYATPEQTYAHPDDQRLRRVAQAESADLLAGDLAQQKRFRNLFVAAFVALGGLAFVIGKWFEGR